jgi:hypothetical protein
MQDTPERTNLDFVVVIIFGLIATGYLFWWHAEHPRMVVRYDCSIAEISPDYPPEVKEGCRKLRAENFKENLQKPK